MSCGVPANSSTSTAKKTRDLFLAHLFCMFRNGHKVHYVCMYKFAPFPFRGNTEFKHWNSPDKFVNNY